MIKKIFRSVKRHFSESEKLLRKAQKFPRYTPVHISPAGLKLHVADLLSVAYQLKEYFFEEEFLLPFPKDSKLKIYDLGANMGIASLYFKKKFPNSEIVAYEADPAICKYLHENIRQNLNEQQAKDITINCQAVWIEDGQVEFEEEGADAGSVVSGLATGKKIPAVNFRRVIEQESIIDFIKMDIEGAEHEVIKAMGASLKKIKSLFIEFHFKEEGKQELDVLLKTLVDYNFQYYLKTGYPVERPFVKVLEKSMSHQISIYAHNQDFFHNKAVQNK